MAKTYFDMGKNLKKPGEISLLLPDSKAAKESVEFFKALERARVEAFRDFFPPVPKPTGK